MSHVVSIKTEFKDLAAVKAACDELGLMFHENQTNIRWFGEWVNDYDAADAAYKLGIPPEKYGTCDHAISLPGCNYDIGLLKNPETGGYKLYFDFWGEGKKIQRALGKNGEKLLQYYAAHKTIATAKAKGWLAKRTIQPNGNITVQLTGMA